MSKIVNIGVMGCANIASKFVIPAISELTTKFKLIAIASREQNKADALAKEHNVLGLLGYEQLIKRSDIDAVYIPLPNALHYKWIKDALLEGKHVLVEKSLACTPEDVNELISLAKEKELILVENFQFRFHPQLKVIKKLIKNGSIGEVRNIKSNFGFPPFSDKNNIRYSKSLGGGALLDAGAYPLKISQELLGLGLYVDSSSLYYCKNFDVDIWGSAQLKNINSKVVSQISFGFDNCYQCNLEVWGSKGIIKAGRIFTCPPSMDANIELTDHSGTQVIKVDADNHFVNMLNYFYQLINKQISVDHEYASTKHQSDLISGVLKSNDK